MEDVSIDYVLNNDCVVASNNFASFELWYKHLGNMLVNTILILN